MLLDNQPSKSATQVIRQKTIESTIKQETVADLISELKTEELNIENWNEDFEEIMEPSQKKGKRIITDEEIEHSTKIAEEQEQNHQEQNL